MKYRFYSRRKGFNSGINVKYFESEIINDKNNDTNNLIEKTGKEIINNIEKLKINDQLKKDILKHAKIYHNWYYYPDNTIFYDVRIFE